MCVRACMHHMHPGLWDGRRQSLPWASTDHAQPRRSRLRGRTSGKSLGEPLRVESKELNGVTLRHQERRKGEESVRRGRTSEHPEWGG